jgi:hypothetical protein
MSLKHRNIRNPTLLYSSHTTPPVTIAIIASNVLLASNASPVNVSVNVRII